MLAASCGGGSNGGGEGVFALIEFLESGQNNIPRNREITLKFSAAVKPGQDFFERLKIENIQTGPNSNFSVAIGVYLVTGDEVVFIPRLPEKTDRSDAGFRANGNYTVFLKGGPDALESVNGDRIDTPQEFLFSTSEFFEDPLPNDAPRALAFVAIDPFSLEETDLSRLSPTPSEVAAMDNASLIAAGHVIDPGIGGDYEFPWRFELRVSEPLDPQTVTNSNVEMFEIFSNATTSGSALPPAAAPGTFGAPVAFKVAINVEARHKQEADGSATLAVRITPLFTLVDNTRYRIRFSGNILGLDYRKAFIGENGLTGDGLTIAEPGGLGYTTEFIVRDRPAIEASRLVTYDPVVDGIAPERGQTEIDEDRWNSALYNPSTTPGQAVGFLSAFGSGDDGPIAVGSGTTTIDTGDTANPLLGNPFQVTDLDPDDVYLTNTLPGGQKTFDSPEPFEVEASAVTIGSTGVLRIIGVNPIFLRVQGIVQIGGTLDVSGADGQDGGGSIATGGVAGAGGFPGGDTRAGYNGCRYCTSCAAFRNYLNSCGPAANTFPHTKHGNGPGRGYAGGEIYVYDYQDDFGVHGGSGGGGGGHGTIGGKGEDRLNAGGAVGSDGPACGSQCPAKMAGIIGIRGEGGAAYGDRMVEDNLLGGSGGAGGGSVSVWGGPKNQAGGAGGGGGGSIAIIASGPILAQGLIDVSGGNGGQGGIAVQSVPNNWRSTSGGGGGGAGGSVALISGAAINLAGGAVTAAGGAGGPRSSPTNCNACNAGGDGGKGFIFLMDADGIIEGLNPATPGEYDNFAGGVLTISTFETSRFSSVSAVTELFNALSADPIYLQLAPEDVTATVAAGQRIRVFVSSAESDSSEPTQPDLTTEGTAFQIALVEKAGVTISVTITDFMGNLNQNPFDRFPFVRVDARFEYDNGVEAALGPFAAIDSFLVRFRFNG